MHEMPGLAAGPMGAWLAAAGLLRMASRADSQVSLMWDGNVPVLIPGMRPAVLRDVTDRASFTPVMTPWQSGGGWGEKDKTPARRLAVLRSSRSPRLDPLRRAIAAADAVMRDHGTEDKGTLVRLLRNSVPDEAVPWLDAAVPLRPDPDHPGTPAAAFAPLAGTGGNDGRWDLSANYHAALLALGPDDAGDEAAARRRGRLHDLLDGTECQPLAETSAGPYWPGAAGLANPWAIVLMAEGLCAFGDSLARVHGEHIQPWTAAAGPETDREPGLGEAWLPLWGAPVTMPELTAILCGPQPRWRGSAARTPAQMYASFRTLGWPRGITGYARYALARRRGRSHEAVPLDLLTPASPLPAMLTARAAAAAAGVAEKTWTSYVARGQAPSPDARDLATGKPGWMQSTVAAWLRSRPGQGVRADLDAR